MRIINLWSCILYECTVSKNMNSKHVLVWYKRFKESVKIYYRCKHETTDWCSAICNVITFTLCLIRSHKQQKDSLWHKYITETFPLVYGKYLACKGNVAVIRVTVRFMSCLLKTCSLNSVYSWIVKSIAIEVCTFVRVKFFCWHVWRVWACWCCTESKSEDERSVHKWWLNLIICV